MVFVLEKTIKLRSVQSLAAHPGHNGHNGQLVPLLVEREASKGAVTALEVNVKENIWMKQTVN